MQRGSGKLFNKVKKRTVLTDSSLFPVSISTEPLISEEVK